MGLPSVDEFFHCLPSFLHGSVLEVDCLAVCTEPFGRVALGRVNIGESNWKMDEEEVKVCGKAKKTIREREAKIYNPIPKDRVAWLPKP